MAFEPNITRIKLSDYLLKSNTLHNLMKMLCYKFTDKKALVTEFKGKKLNKGISS